MTDTNTMNDATRTTEANDSSTAGERLVLYEFYTSKNFLAAQLFPAAERLPIELETSADELLERWPDDRDQLLFQVNLSLTAGVPAARRRLLDTLQERGVFVLNASVDDIRKSTLHRLLDRLGLPSAAAARDGDPDERVMVKTDCNYGGIYEHSLDPELRRRLGILETDAPITDWSEYQCLRRADVDPAWWDDPSLVIERYIDNHEGRFYRTYRAGDHVTIIEAYGSGTIKKVSGGPRDINYTATLERLREIDADGALPLALVRLVDRFFCGAGLDFGSIDIMDDGAGGLFIVDLNDTPYGGQMVVGSEATAHLRRGLDSY
ncbi:MAG: hypothetical protein AAGC60_18700 [Acidobacteriota bacterium]